MLGGHLPAFTGEFQQAVLVDGLFQPRRETQLINGFQAFQMDQHMPWFWGNGWLA
jgi:hypothetical protein